MKKRISISFLLIATLVQPILSQSILLKEVNLETQIQKTKTIIEGKVVDRQSYWDDNYQNIYTINTIEVFKVFKGDSSSKIDIITHGGVIGLEAEIVSPSLTLKLGDIGVFMINDFNDNIFKQLPTKQKLHNVYAVSQGFFKYNLDEDKASNSFLTVNGITSAFYHKIEAETKKNYTEIIPLTIEHYKTVKESRSTIALVISSLSPINVTAGTKSILTIIGNDFGNSKGKIGFSNADDAGSTFTDAIDTQIKSWTNTKIEVEIPSKAGTGPVRITTTGGASLLSSQELNVMYAQNNIISDALINGVLVAYPTQLINNNSKGGYTLNTTSKLNNIPMATESLGRAVSTWSCETKMNWELGTFLNSGVVPQSKSARDGYNVITFEDSSSSDPANVLSDNVLGKRISYYSACSVNNGTDLKWYANEFDIIFDDEALWNFEKGLPTDSQIDFESVALHELGHCRQLSHVIDTENVMHFAIAKGENLRVLSVNNKNVAEIIHYRSTGANVCQQPAMLSANCEQLSVTDLELIELVAIYPNPTRGQLFIKNKSNQNLKQVEVYDIQSRLITSLQDVKDSRETQINLTNYSKGLYLIRLYFEDTFVTKRIVLK